MTNGGGGAVPYQKPWEGEGPVAAVLGAQSSPGLPGQDEQRQDAARRAVGLLLASCSAPERTEQGR